MTFLTLHLAVIILFCSGLSFTLRLPNDSRCPFSLHTAPKLLNKSVKPSKFPCSLNNIYFKISYSTSFILLGLGILFPLLYHLSLNQMYS